MTKPFSAKQPGLCRVCRGVIAVDDPTVEISIPGKDRARWAHAACGIAVATGARVWDASSGIDGDFVVGVPGDAPSVTTEAVPEAVIERRTALAKILDENSDDVALTGYVIKVGATTFESAWLYGGVVEGPSIDPPIDWLSEVPAGQFGNENEAKLAAVNELSAMILERRDATSDRTARKGLADVAEAINKHGEGIEAEVKAAEKEAKKSTAPAATQTTEGQTSGGDTQAADAPTGEPADKGAEGKPPRKPRKKKGEPDPAKPAEPSLLDGNDASGDGAESSSGEDQSGQAGEGGPPEPDDKPQQGLTQMPGKAPESSPDGLPGSDAAELPFGGPGDPEGLLDALDARIARVVKPLIDEALVGFVPAGLSWESANDERPRHWLPTVARSTAVGTMPAVRHEKFQDVLELAKARRNILLVGPTQGGKTTLAEQIATALGLPFHCIGCSIGMTESQLKGRLIPVGEGGRFEYQISALVNAYEHGGVCLVDEIDAGGPDVLVALNAPLSNDWIPVEARVDNPIARRHPDFICIASANTFGNGADRMYVGRQQLDFATLQRFAVGQIEMGYSADIEKAVCPDESLRTSLTNFRAAIDELNAAAAYSIRRAVSTRFMADAYIMLTEAKWPIDKIFTQLICGWSPDEVNRVKEVLKAKQNGK